MSFGGLYIGVSGLSAAQRAMELAGHNVANANTPGYTRQRLELRSNNPSDGPPGAGMMGTGVKIADVVRIRNEFVDSAFRAELSNGKAWGARSDILARAERVLGTLDSGAPDALNRFWGAWDTLSLDPTDTAARQGVIDAGRRISSELRSASDQLSRLGSEVNLQIREDVAKVNALATDLARVNQSIKDAEVSGQTPNDLFDQQDRLIDEISGLTGTIVRRGPHGSADVYIGSMPLVRGEHTNKLAVGTDNPPVVTFASTGVATQLAGTIGARMEAVHDTLPSLHADLDALAVGLRDLVNGQHAAGFDLNGDAGGPFFSATGAADLQVDTAITTDRIAASAGGASADGNNAVAMGGLRGSPAVGGRSVIDALAAFGSRLGSLTSEAATAAQSSDVVLGNLSSERAVTNSVSVDEELADMVRYQRAYEAAARVITTVDQMLDTLINRTGIVGR